MAHPPFDPSVSGDLAARAQAIVDALPHQPVVAGADGALGFHPNGVVQVMFRSHQLSLEDLLAMDFPRQDLAQFVQLLGMDCQAVAAMGLLPDPLPAPVDQPVHPFQPPVLDDDRIRFRPNKVIKHLLGTGPMDLNDLVRQEEATQPNWQQLAQLIGYSLEGFAELQAATDEAYDWAMAQWETREARMARVRQDLLSQVLDGTGLAEDTGRPGIKPRI